MTRWKYFVVTGGDAERDPRPRALGRHDEDGPRYNAETLDRAARWQWSEFLMRYHWRGTTDNDYRWITEQEADAIVEEWVASGRLVHPPGQGPAWRYFTSKGVRLGRSDPDGPSGNGQVLTREGTWVNRPVPPGEPVTPVTEDDAYQVVSDWLVDLRPWRRLKERPAEPSRDHRSAWKRSLEES